MQSNAIGAERRNPIRKEGCHKCGLQSQCAVMAEAVSEIRNFCSGQKAFTTARVTSYVGLE